MQTEKTDVITEELRSILSGEKGKNEGILARCAEKIAHWQQVAHKYHGHGLSRRELGDFWREINEQRTNVELILQISAKRKDWAAVSQEVKAFIDELTYEMKIADDKPRELTAAASEDNEEEWQDVDDEVVEKARVDLMHSYCQQLAEKYSLSARSKMVTGLAAALAHMQTKQAEMWQRLAAGEKLETLPLEQAVEQLDQYIESLEEEVSRLTTQVMLTDDEEWWDDTDSD